MGALSESGESVCVGGSWWEPLESGESVGVARVGGSLRFGAVRGDRTGVGNG